MNYVIFCVTSSALTLYNLERVLSVQPVLSVVNVVDCVVMWNTLWTVSWYDDPHMYCQ